MSFDSVKIYYAFYRDYQTIVTPLIEEDFDIILKKKIDMISVLETKLEGRL
jgi:hypothetical protein